MLWNEWLVNIYRVMLAFARNNNDTLVFDTLVSNV